MRVGRYVFEEADLIKFLDAVTVVQSVPTPIPIPTEPPPDPMRHLHMLYNAANEIGVREGRDEARIEEYHRFASKNNDNDQSQETSWCSSFMCWAAETCISKITSTDSMLARSWLSWGRSSMNDPQAGDIIVYWRVSPTSWEGHVGLYIDRTHTLGGNQSNSVCLDNYGTDRILDIRRSTLSPVTYSASQLDQLNKLRDDILRGVYG